MDGKLTTLSRIFLVICGFSLVFVLFNPIWRIELAAPQYPEGLSLLIYADKLAGDVDIINGLNHYIGMKTLHTDDFVEFKVLPGLIIFFSICFILVGLLGRRLLVNILFSLFVAFGVLAMVDFWRWEYNYGHNLDPNAAIIVPGMAYQPPLIGFKQLLNFGAYSIPDIGGWIFIGAGAVLMFVVIKEWRLLRRRRNAGLAVVGVMLMSSCSTAPEPIAIGRDSCSFCEMKISDNRFGGEIVTKKGKIFKFDDPHCLLAFTREEKQVAEQIDKVYFVNFNEPHELLPADVAFYLQSPDLKTPMNGNVAAFSTAQSRESAFKSFYGNFISWEDMQK